MCPASDDEEDEWAIQAQEYFSKSLFLEAAFCFRKAKMTWWTDVAQAYGDRQEAMRLAENHPNRLPAFLEVARTFDHLAQEGNITGGSESSRLLYLNAAESYVVLFDHAPAANAFLKARRYMDAAYHYRMAGMFDEAIEVMKLHPIDPDLAESITYAAKFVFTKKKDIPSLQSVPPSLDVN